MAGLGPGKGLGGGRFLEHTVWAFLVGQLDLVWSRSLGPAGVGLAGQLEYLVIVPSCIIKVDGELRNDALRHL